eukprot:gb/GEZN01016343.1/.p1 GENE.gb/GEZN01016343.1/~~gb/GEZN01016343.1/.p1  ORF type:complete len:193 (-),score=31.45 gb/GEZN01016343.1/:237-815(-)
MLRGVFLSVPLLLLLISFQAHAKKGGKDSDDKEAKASKEGEQGKPSTYSFTVSHAPVITINANPGILGGLGDLYVLPATPLYMSDPSTPVGRLDATLVTTTVDFPFVGDEVRMSTLNFVFGNATSQFSGSADQIQVSGSGYYPSALSTFAPGTELIRPLTGGSGRFSGATGECRSNNLGDKGWTHTFTLWQP